VCGDVVFQPLVVQDCSLEEVVGRKQHSSYNCRSLGSRTHPLDGDEATREAKYEEDNYCREKYWAAGMNSKFRLVIQTTKKS